MLTKLINKLRGTPAPVAPLDPTDPLAILLAEARAQRARFIGDFKDNPKNKGVAIGKLRMSVNGRRCVKATPTRMYRAEGALAKLLARFPDQAPVTLCRTISGVYALEPVTVARLWRQVKARYDHQQAMLAMKEAA